MRLGRGDFCAAVRVSVVPDDFVAQVVGLSEAMERTNHPEDAIGISNARLSSIRRIRIFLNNCACYTASTTALKMRKFR